MPTIDEPQYHAGNRQPCAMCGSKLFVYAQVWDDAGNPLHALCTADYHRVMGNALCGACQRPVVLHPTTGELQHAEPKPNGQPHKHPAIPTRDAAWYRDQDARLRAIGAGQKPQDVAGALDAPWTN